MGFNSLWNRERAGFEPSAYGGSAQGEPVFESSRPAAGPSEDAPGLGDATGPDPDGEGAASPTEPEPYDPAADGWIRVEDHEAALATAREEAAREAVEELEDDLADRTEQLKGLIEALERTVGERQWLRQEVIADASEDVVTLSLELSRRVAGETLAVHPRALQHLVHEAMAALPGDDGVRVRVRPEDLPILEHHVDSRRPITWVPDPELKQGVVVQTDLGQVESSLETAFEALQAAVSDWLEQQRS